MRPSIHATMIEVAHCFSQRGTCSRLKVGAVVYDDDSGRILGHGYNGALAGQQHCYHTEDRSCTESIHAEMNAVVNAHRNGVPVIDANIACTHAPCVPCARLIAASGIKTVIYDWDYRNADGVEWLTDRGVEVTRWDMFIRSLG